MAAKLLRVCFFVYGLVMATAIVFVFVPNRSMIQVGQKLGLPAFEVTPMFEYMARGLSLGCFLAGVLLIYLGLHLSEHTRFIRFLGWTCAGCLVGAIYIHIKVATPWWWKLGDILGMALLPVMCFAASGSDRRAE